MEREDLHSTPCEHVQRLHPSDRAAVRALAEACAPTEWEDSGLAIDGDPLFGYFESERLLAVAGTIRWVPHAANPGAITHPNHRNKGLGKAVPSAAMSHILSEGDVELFQTLLNNHAPVNIAEALGCKLYTCVMYIGLTDIAGQQVAGGDGALATPQLWRQEADH